LDFSRQPEQKSKNKSIHFFWGGEGGRERKVCGKREKQGKITQHRVIFRNRDRAKEERLPERNNGER